MSPHKRLSPQELAENKERANFKRKLRHLWRSDETLDEICVDLGLTPERLAAVAAEMNLGERPETVIYLPTQEEIRLAAAEIRAGWSRAELEARRTSRRAMLE